MTKEILIKAIKTFIQAALGYLCTISVMDIEWSNKQVVITIILSAVSAGISALMNIDWDKAKEIEVPEEEGEVNE